MFDALMAKHYKTVEYGVRTLLARPSNATDNTFWHLHLMKMPAFLQFVDASRTALKRDLSSLDPVVEVGALVLHADWDTLESELWMVTNAAVQQLRTMPAQYWASDQFLLRGLIFSNVNAYFAAKGNEDVLHEIWPTYVQSCHAFQIRPVLEDATPVLKGGSRALANSDFAFSLSIPIDWSTPNQPYRMPVERLDVAFPIFGPRVNGFRVNMILEAIEAGTVASEVQFFKALAQSNAGGGAALHDVGDSTSGSFKVRLLKVTTPSTGVEQYGAYWMNGYYAWRMVLTTPKGKLNAFYSNFRDVLRTIRMAAPTPQAAPSSGGSRPYTDPQHVVDKDDIVGQLERLASLRRQGLISEDEYQAAKSRILPA